jgi:uncharacterized protein YutE (UPF0331/DUF86 family)
MTDADLLAKKLARIETHVAELRSLARPEEIRRDVREERFIERTLQLAIQNALDAASHIVSDERLGEPRTNRELFEILERHGWLPPDLAERLRDMAGFRNVLVHGYEAVDLGIVEDVVRHHLDDLVAFVQAVRSHSAG